MENKIKLALKQQSRLPLSLKMKYMLRARLERGEWPVGTQIPTLLELVSEYGVSRATIRAALDELEQEGLIERTRGKGTYVIGDVLKEHWMMLPTDWVTLIGHIDRLNVDFIVLENRVGRLPADLVGGGEAVPDDYWHTTRVNLIKGVPYSMSSAYVTHALYTQQKKAFEQEPVLLVLDRAYKPLLVSARQTLTVRAADATASRHLKVEIGSPVVRVVRVVRDAQDSVVYCAEVLYPARHLYIENDLRP